MVEISSKNGKIIDIDAKYAPIVTAKGDFFWRAAAPKRAQRRAVQGSPVLPQRADTWVCPQVRRM